MTHQQCIIQLILVPKLLKLNYSNKVFFPHGHHSIRA
uniref:Uncharacterized protein n=1 Tax=Arundo donax TaxID=35708 RepID=A0A0A8ZU41_ARUDO